MIVTIKGKKYRLTEEGEDLLVCLRFLGTIAGVIIVMALFNLLGCLIFGADAVNAVWLP